ncbi:MAG: Lipase family protein [uncultured bacterium (gcode 4)]|uniref:Lipase family protein n=1 Tax=uncultured bacterium (gcode 4) TaxID=1234023 RepID=K1ZJ79_9BACT|nr:MAG: Lipase family protein [uncultured bacterium (gcode 4)]
MAPSFESNSFEHPSFERMWGDFEWAKELLPEPREATPEQIQKSKEHNTLANRLYQQNSITEALLRSNFEEGFSKNLDVIWRTGDISFLTWDEGKNINISIHSKEGVPEKKIDERISEPLKPREITLPQTEKQTKNPDTLGEKEKLTTYAELSDLAYVDFISVPDPKDLTKTSQKISKVHLDPLAFPNFKMIAEGKIPEKPTEDERIIMTYLDTHKNDINNPVEQWIRRAKNDRKIAPDIADLLRLASGWSKQYQNTIQYAGLDEKYQTTMIDTNPNLPSVSKIPSSEIMTEGGSRMIDAMEHLRTIKEKQASTTLDMIRGKGFEIVDYFPNEINKDKTSSGFGAICLKDKMGNMHFAIRWTELTDWGDIVADMRLAMKHVPENQTQDLITFFERNLKDLPKDQKVSITGHSLWGALTQIASVMYAERVGESYTFNSPGAKKLNINPEGKSEIIRWKFEKFRDFEYNGGNEWSVESRITNARWAEWPSIISNLGEDIGNYEILLKSLKSHSITEVIRYINELKEGSLELQRHYVWPDKKEETSTPSF